MKAITWAALVSLVIVAPSASTTWYVNPDGTGDFLTIQAAFSVAAYWDTVLVASAIYHEHDLWIPSGVRLISETQDPLTTVIDAEGLGRCLSASSSGAIVRGITLRNGTHPVEGGLGLMDDALISFHDCVFSDGTAPRGGAFSIITDRHPNFYDCRFESNEATSGGAIYVAVFVTCDRCEFVDNVAQEHGGAIFAQKSSIDGLGGIVSQSTFTNNHAGGDGGAVYSTGRGANEYYGTYLGGCTLMGNTATNGGAARLNLYDCVSGCSFVDNHATGRGGALDLVGLDTNLAPDCDRFDRTLFARNSAALGGACALTGSYVFFIEDTFAQNDASSGGHLWMSGDSAMWVWQVILAFAGGGAAAAGGSSNVTCSDVYGNSGGDYVGPFAGANGVSGNRSVDPLFCDMAADDYTLQEGSPCLPPQPAGCGYTGGIVGAFGQGCGGVSVEPSSWGCIKARYR